MVPQNNGYMEANKNGLCNHLVSWLHSPFTDYCRLVLTANIKDRGDLVFVDQNYQQFGHKLGLLCR